ncbi:DUF3050 domain-containing protein [Synechococcus sp. CS-1325]|uniref:DUF3050 domain-containing protein n=1 Tax=Synechococcus sp. CS-1325 TaxID=2847979 RepID=UPI000DB68BA3|nr:DUF3050 domain-containing protein [Synechococcus sp. CS-1325]MCT0199585.1 DUF3050 domain-containing protein [Synechococcus sp. CS-1325]PZV02767.1 MAG: hypothetical protein DCF24_00910 [Cyanobium sp.]
MTLSASALADHPLGRAIQDLPSLRLFMEHHVYAVWDFLLLAKALQWQLSKDPCPDQSPNPAAMAVINRIVAEEESDQAPANPLGASHLSHLQIYLLAMQEVGACTATIEQLMTRLPALEPWALGPAELIGALEGLAVPHPSRRFMAFTFDVIGSAEALPMAVAFTHGRELLVASLFQGLLDRALIPPLRAPSLHWYLTRHIALDGEDHGPMALAMVSDLCGRSSARLQATQTIAHRAVEARRQFWDGIHLALTPA